MKKKDETEELLNSYFKTYRQEIEDNGFVDKTLKSLPTPAPFFSKKDIYITVCLIISTILFVPCLNVIREIIFKVNLYSLSFIILSLVGIVFTIIMTFDTETDSI
jgi:hypothetical protein